tara:strand:+ start:5291 stop:5668 length:378 start_codon:yes stop_codon:yes gene_type:complete
METNMTESESKIECICDEIKELLISKNRKYGNSALEPCRVFSKSSAVEQLLVRIDDKLNRVMQGAGLLDKDEDVINDLIGYLVLLKIGMNQEKMINLQNTFEQGYKHVNVSPYTKDIPQEDDYEV